jgi:2-polyprenyl-6-methoxyphenol hydroxylase-like FAD-dependent oxidoreductase
VTVLRGVVPQDLGLTELEEWWGRGLQFGATPNPGSTTNWFATMPERRFVDMASALADARARFATFPARVRQVLELADPSLSLLSGISVSRGLARVVSGRSVLIGDSAHAMAPNLGRGACESLRDAVRLGELMSRHEPVEALERYRYRRLVQPQLVKSASTVVMRVSLADRLAAPRDRLLRLVA